MAETTKIAWCDSTFNPWIGCTKVSPGCANCYAERDFGLRKGVATWGADQPRHRTAAANWRQPLKWNRKEEGKVGSHAEFVAYRKPRVFCGSLCDWLDDEVPVEWLADLLDLIRRTPSLDWLLLSKRPQNWLDRMAKVFAFAMWSPTHHNLCAWVSQWHPAYGSAGGAPCAPIPPANVWIGTTVEDQERADERIPALLSIPVRVRFLSVEPMLGPVDLALPRYGIDDDGKVRCRCGQSHCGVCTSWKPAIHWVICGGESGPGARPMHPDWARSLRDQCATAQVPFLFKQWGEWAPGECVPHGARKLQCATHDGEYWDLYTQTAKESEECHAEDAPHVYRIGKHAAGRLLDGREHNEFSEVQP